MDFWVMQLTLAYPLAKIEVAQTFNLHLSIFQNMRPLQRQMSSSFTINYLIESGL